MKREELINDKAIELKGMVGLALSIDECIIFVNSVLASHPEPQPQEQETNEQLRCSNCGELIGNCDNSCWYRDRDELHEFKLGEQEKPQKPQITESEQEDITNAFCETRDENIKNNLQYRGRDYFQAGYDFAMSSQKHIPTDSYPKECQGCKTPINQSFYCPDCNRKWES